MLRRMCMAVIMGIFVLVFFGTAVFPLTARSATEKPTILTSPAEGSFEVGTTFDVHIAVNTAGQSINAFKVKLRFQPDKLQVVSPGIGHSVAGLWVRRPSYSNETGEINLEGAIPSPGINSSFGILTTVTFRVKTPGFTTLRFSEESALYLNDGQGTSVDKIFQNGLYRLVLPAPQGPFVTSPTHPDQDTWYAVKDIQLRWNNTNPVGGYSYILNQTPIDIPDNISDGNIPETGYNNVADGIYYFHVKALRDGVWGGSTHFGLKIQTGAPAEFSVDVLPGDLTASRDIVVTFETTDPLSGMDHYEIKITRLDASAAGGSTSGNPFFFETQSPYFFHVDEYGKYEFIVRAFNQAGTYREASVKVSVVKPLLRFLTAGGILFHHTVISWFIFWPLIVAFIVMIWYLLGRVFRWHLHLEFYRTKNRKDRLGVLQHRLNRPKDKR